VRLACDEWYATWVLRLILDSSKPGDWATRVNEEILLPLARQNGVLVRTVERLEGAGIQMSPTWVHAVEVERQRVHTAIRWIGRISTLCAENGLEFLFPKASQHYPDMGRDLDLLLLSRSIHAEARVIGALPAVRCRRGLAHWIAGTATYRIEGCALPLDVHHGRLGLAGEHSSYPAILIQNRRSLSLNGKTFMVPSHEDQLVLQGMQGVYARRYLRLADIVATIASLSENGLDWDYIAAISRRLGTLPGLSSYLHTVDAIHARVLGSELLTREQSRCLDREGWRQAGLCTGCYPFPANRVAARLYGRKLLAAAACGDWVGAGRLCLLPLVVLSGRGARRRIEQEQKGTGVAVAAGRCNGQPASGPIDR
jgi:hypothetical protein